MPLEWINRDGKLIILSRAFRLFAQGSISILLVIYLKQVGFSLIQVGFFISSGVLGAAVFSILVAVVGDAIGRRHLLIFFSASRIVAGVALAITHSFPLLVVIGFITAFVGSGGGGGAAQPVAQASLADTAPADRRNDLYAVYNTFGVGGGAIGALFAGLPVLLQNTFDFSELSSFKFMMFWYAFFNLIAALLAAMLSPAVEVSVSKGGRRWVNPLTLPSRRKIFMAGGLFSVEHFATSLVVQGLVAFWFFEKFEIQLDSLALIFFASNIGAASSFWVGAKLANRFGLINTMVLTHLPSGLLLIAIPFVPEAWMAIVIWLLFVLGQRMSMPMRLSYTMAIVEPHERLAMATLSRMGHNVSMASGPPIATFLYSFAATAVPFVASGVIQMSGDLLLYAKFRNVKPPEETRREAEGKNPALPETPRKREEGESRG